MWGRVAAVNERGKLSNYLPVDAELCSENYLVAAASYSVGQPNSLCCYVANELTTAATVQY